MKTIILASGSPRRQELLKMLNIPFKTMASNVSEDISDVLEIDNSPYERVKYLSTIKARAVAAEAENNSVIIGCDTVVAHMGRILNKPADDTEAKAMLCQLSGRKHSVYTGLTIINKTEDGGLTEKTYVDCTEVSMLPISDEEIINYIASGECADKAGAYAIQGKGSIFIESITGDYYTVMGLPVRILAAALKEFGINVTDYWK